MRESIGGADRFKTFEIALSSATAARPCRLDLARCAGVRPFWPGVLTEVGAGKIDWDSGDRDASCRARIVGGANTPNPPARAGQSMVVAGVRQALSIGRRMKQAEITIHELYAAISGDLRRVEQIFDNELVSDLSYMNDLCGRIRTYRGKMLRPALLLLTARACGALRPVHHTLAAVVEMVHMATLVHDDVLDGADERRRQPTICATEGNVGAVLLGDYLISHAFHLCSSLRDSHASRRIGATTNTVCEGELLQNALSGDDSVSETQYLEIIHRKTGALTACCGELGAYYAGADAETTARLHRFGRTVGAAFQIIDDVLDITGHRDEVGKTLSLDVSLGKLTLPTIHFLRHADSAAAEALRAAIRGERPCAPESIRQWLAETGSIDYAVTAARNHISDALQCLDGLPESEARTALAAMAEFVVSRRL